MAGYRHNGIEAQGRGGCGHPKEAAAGREGAHGSPGRRPSRSADRSATRPADRPATRPAARSAATRAVRGLTLAASALLIPALVGCGADETARADSRPSKGPSIPPAAPANIEKIASMTGCDAEIRIEADELREGVCRTSLGNYVVTTFPKEKFKLTWLDAASMYGGKYLVGPRWAIGGRLEVLNKLRTKVGGRIEDTRFLHSPAPSASPDPGK